jgi:hypothetical protein
LVLKFNPKPIKVRRFPLKSFQRAEKVKIEKIPATA